LFSNLVKEFSNLVEGTLISEFRVGCDGEEGLDESVFDVALL